MSGTGFVAHAPYTAAVDTRTMRRTPTAAAASSTRRVPSTLTRAISASSTIGSVTAARCTTVSQPAQQRVELAAGDVDEVVLVAGDGADRIAHVEPDDPGHAGGGERGHEAGADEAGRAGDGDRAGDGRGRHGSP